MRVPSYLSALARFFVMSRPKMAIQYTACLSLFLMATTYGLPTIASTETRVQQYTSKLRQTYGYFNGAKAQPMNLMFRHINQLLKQSGTLSPSRHSHYQVPFSLRLSKENQALVTTATLQQAPNIRLQKRTSFAVSGINPAVRQHCDRLDQRCWVMHPASQQPWLELSFNPSLSQEVAHALSMLILAMQKSS